MAGSKLYEVVNIDFWDLTIEAREMNLDISNISENEVFRLQDFKEFHVTLCNKDGKIVDFREWVKGHRKS